MIGMVMLMGLVTKNAILLIDMTNHYVREGLAGRRGDPHGWPDSPAADSDDDDGDDPRHAAVGAGPRRRRRVPRADFDCDDRRADHVDGVDAGRRAGRISAARTASSSGSRRGARTRLPQLHPAVRVTGVLSSRGAGRLVPVGGGGLRARRHRGSAPAARRSTLTFDEALARAMRSHNEGLKVVQEQVRESQGRVAGSEGRTSCRR